MKCKQCDEKVEELYDCERCNDEVCLDCCTNDYPYNNTICNECADEFQCMYEDWWDNGK